MLIDMHNHTAISSPCSRLDPEELIETARERGLDALCVTDHHHIEGPTVAMETGRRMGFPVFRGIEATTDHGDMLVFGWYEDIPAGLPLGELCRRVHAGRGLVFAAHPFHVWGGATLDDALRAKGIRLHSDWNSVPVLRELDGIEVLNGQVAAVNNRKAGTLAANLGLPGIGGSDAHSLAMIGRAATRFERTIADEADLVEALRTGRFAPIALEVPETPEESLSPFGLPWPGGR